MAHYFGIQVYGKCQISGHFKRLIITKISENNCLNVPDLKTFHIKPRESGHLSAILDVLKVTLRREGAIKGFLYLLLTITDNSTSESDDLLWHFSPAVL